MARNPPRSPLPWLVRLGLAGTLGVSLVSLGRGLVPVLEHLPDRIERLGTVALTVRERRALTPRVPGLFDGAALVAPIFEGAGHLEVPLVYLRSESAPPWPSLEGAVLLGYHFAPGARCFGLPLAMFRRKLEGAGPGQPAPELLGDLHGAEVLLLGGVDDATVEALIALATRQFGGVAVLTRGPSAGMHHVLLVGNLPDRIRRGEPDAARYRSLLR